MNWDKAATSIRIHIETPRVSRKCIHIQWPFETKQKRFNLETADAAVEEEQHAVEVGGESDFDH